MSNIPIISVLICCKYMQFISLNSFTVYPVIYKCILSVLSASENCLYFPFWCIFVCIKYQLKPCNTFTFTGWLWYQFGFFRNVVRLGLGYTLCVLHDTRVLGRNKSYFQTATSFLNLDDTMCVVHCLNNKIDFVARKMGKKTSILSYLHVVYITY